jgi:hypothetical protein
MWNTCVTTSGNWYYIITRVGLGVIDMRKKHILVLSITIISAIVIALFTYWQWHNVHKQGNEILALQSEQTSDSTVPNSQSGSNTNSIDRNFIASDNGGKDTSHKKVPDSTITAINGKQAQNENDEDDPVVAAQKHLKWIADNPTKWGQISPEATELIQQLTPTRRGAGEEILDTIAELVKLRDPRSPSIFVDYYYAGVWGEAIEQALIEIGPPSVPALLPLLDDSSIVGRARAAKVLSVIATEYRQDLGGIVEFILLPELEKLAISDPDPIVRQYSSDAISQIR